MAFFKTRDMQNYLIIMLGDFYKKSKTRKRNKLLGHNI